MEIDKKIGKKGFQYVFVDTYNEKLDETFNLSAAGWFICCETRSRKLPSCFVAASYTRRDCSIWSGLRRCKVMIESAQSLEAHLDGKALHTLIEIALLGRRMMVQM